MKNNKKIPTAGFSLLEVLVSVSIFSIILLTIISFIFLIGYYNSKTKAERETWENGQRVLEQVINEIRRAKGIYTPTTTQNQLSLETTKYLPQDEVGTFIDFFVCGSALCVKKESQNPVALTSESVQISNLSFVQIANGLFPSVQITLTVGYKNPVGGPGGNVSVTLTSTASLRSY